MTGSTSLYPVDLLCHSLKNGVKVPCLGYLIQDDCKGQPKKTVDTLLSAGFRHIAIGSDVINASDIGHALSAWFKSKKLQREEVFITLFVDPAADPRRGSLRQRLQARLRVLACVHFDLVLLENKDGIKTNLKDNIRRCDQVLSSWQTLDQAKEEKLCHCVGLANYSADDLNTLRSASQLEPDVVWSRDTSIADPTLCTIQCDEPLGISFTLDNRGVPSSLQNTDTVLPMAKRYKRSTEQICVRYFLQRGLLTMVTAQRDIAKCFMVLDFYLSVEDMYELSQLL